MDIFSIFSSYTLIKSQNNKSILIYIPKQKERCALFQKMQSATQLIVSSPLTSYHSENTHNCSLSFCDTYSNPSGPPTYQLHLPDSHEASNHISVRLQQPQLAAMWQPSETEQRDTTLCTESNSYKIFWSCLGLPSVYLPPCQSNQSKHADHSVSRLPGVFCHRYTER